MNTKILISVLVIGAIAIIGGVLLLSQGSDPTPIPNDLLTYRNDEFGFEFEHPSDWGTLYEGRRKTLYVMPKNRIEVLEQAFPGGIDTPPNIEIIVTEQIPIHETKGCVEVLGERAVSINGVSGIQYDEALVNCGESEYEPRKATIIGHKALYYDIRLNSMSDEQVYEQLLDSLKL